MLLFLNVIEVNSVAGKFKSHTLLLILKRLEPKILVSVRTNKIFFTIDFVILIQVRFCDRLSSRSILIRIYKIP